MIDTFLRPTHISDDLKNVVILVTGAGRGIGKAIAEALRKEGASLALFSLDEEELHLAFPEKDEKILLITGNVTSEKDTLYAISKTLDRFGKIDVLINNAGINIEKPLDETSLAEFHSIFDTNVQGVFLMTRGVLPHMKKKKEGFIINIGSKISHNTNVAPSKVLYAATKYAVEGFSFALGKELKPFGIRVTCLMPGTVNTFLSLAHNKFLSPHELAALVVMLIRFKDLDFESIVVKSIRQDI